MQSKMFKPWILAIFCSFIHYQITCLLVVVCWFHSKVCFNKGPAKELQEEESEAIDFHQAWESQGIVLFVSVCLCVFISLSHQRARHNSWEEESEATKFHQTLWCEYSLVTVFVLFLYVCLFVCLFH